MLFLRVTWLPSSHSLVLRLLERYMVSWNLVSSVSVVGQIFCLAVYQNKFSCSTNIRSLKALYLILYGVIKLTKIFCIVETSTQLIIITIFLINLIIVLRLISFITSIYIFLKQMMKCMWWTFFVKLETSFPSGPLEVNVITCLDEIRFVVFSFLTLK